MCKKSLIALLLIASSLVTSCVDKNYDLANKEITTDVKLEGETIALPVGGLKPVVLDSLIDVSEIDMLVKDANGVYAISMEDSIAVEEEIEAITLDIDPFEYSHSIKDFGRADIESVHIDPMSVSADINTPTISVDNLNDHLPHLTHSHHQDIEIPGLDLGIVVNFVNNMGGYTYPIPEPFTIKTGEQSVNCSIEYELPEQIETIKSIKLGSKSAKNGTLVMDNVTYPAVLESCDRTLDVAVEFPQNFKLAKNPTAEGDYKIEGNKVTLKDFKPQGDETKLSFYITEITDIDQYIEYGKICFDEDLKYSIDYTIEGDLTLKKGVTEADFAFDVNLDLALSFSDLAGKTKDVEVKFPGVDLEFKGSLNNLKNVSEVKYVEFDETASCIMLSTTIDKDWFSAFELKEGYALKIGFPKGLMIDLDETVITTGAGETVGVDFVYNESDSVYDCYVSDLSILSISDWKIALKTLVLNIPVEKDGHCELSRSVEIKLVNMDNPDESGHFYLKGLEMESMVAILDKLNNANRKAEFKLEKSDLVIVDAVVSTTEISASLDGQEMSIDIKEEIPSEIKRIERIGFKDDVLVTMTLDVEGLDEMKSNINLDLDMSLPSFLALKPYDANSGVTVGDGSLNIHTIYNPSSLEPLEIKLWCCGIDFTTEEFGFDGYEPLIGDDGKSYIDYSTKVAVDGKVSVDAAEFHSTMLTHDILFNLELNIDEIVVKSFHGLYCAEISGVEEEIELDLGEELDFLKDASLTLADPQLELALTNPIGVPVDVELHIFGKDDNGNVIESSVIETTLSIAPAAYDEATDELSPVETKIFLSTSEIGKAGYENICLENLGSLLAEIPSSLSLNVVPVIKSGAGITHHVDISQPIKLDAAYSVVVPFKFEDLQFCYSDTISGLKGSIDETIDVLSNVSLGIGMDIINTIPLGLSLTVVPLDENDNVIDDIEISKLEVKAGDGESLLKDDKVTVAGGLTVQHFEFAIKSAKGDITSLDKLAFSIEAASTSAIGSVGLKGEQGIKISNIVLEVSGDVEVDLGK